MGIRENAAERKRKREQRAADRAAVGASAMAYCQSHPKAKKAELTAHIEQQFAHLKADGADPDRWQNILEFLKTFLPLLIKLFGLI